MSLAVLAAIQASSAMVKLSFSGNIVSSFAQHRAYMPPSSHSYSSCTSCLPLNRQLHHGLLTRGLATDNDNFIHTNRTRPLMYSYYVREISLCVGASCVDAPKSCISPQQLPRERQIRGLRERTVLPFQLGYRKCCLQYCLLLQFPQP